MATLSYRQTGLTLRKSGGAADQQVRDLQRDLRRLGYLRRGVDGDFGGGTELAVKALQHDLLANDGRGNDGNAPVKVKDYNRDRVGTVTGAVDQSLVECISDILDDAKFPKLPASATPAEDNRKIVTQIAAMPSAVVPVPFLLAILTQESGLKHFCEPRGQDEDSFITTGLDTNEGEKHIITSRGYGAGQYTLFHHPATETEVRDLMLDPRENVMRAVRELREKFDRFVNGPDGKTRADDRIAEFGTGKLRLCKFATSDARFMKDCRQCLLDAGSEDIQEGHTRLHNGTAEVFTSTQYYNMSNDPDTYQGVPVRAKIGCDWPYAVRRYNGSGINSYHYQVRVLQHLLAL